MNRLTVALGVLVAASCMLAILSFAFFYRRPVQEYRQGQVSGGSLKAPISLILVHRSDEHYINVDGRMFSRVRGASPFYLSVPQLNSILFVTEDRAGRATFHLFNVTAGTDVEIVGGNSDFGGHIGAPRPPGDDLTDYIESADTTAVVLATRNANRKIITVLDLTSRTVAKVEDVVLDSNGRDVQDRKRSASEQNL